MSAELKKLAEVANVIDHNERADWYTAGELMSKTGVISYPKNARFIAAASPDAILKLIAERDALYEALKAAMQSLETISLLAGRKTYGNPPIETYLTHFDEVRGYAASRAGVAKEALALVGDKP
jgi:hypothetical protein